MSILNAAYRSRLYQCRRFFEIRDGIVDENQIAAGSGIHRAHTAL